MWLLVLLPTVAGGPLAGQTGKGARDGGPPSNWGILAPGQRVRIDSPLLVHWRIEGVLLPGDGEIRVRPDGTGTTVALAPGDVTRLQVRTGSRRAYWEGAFLGLFVGLAVAEAIVGAEKDDGIVDPSCGRDHCYGPGFRIGLVLGGGGAGGLVGSLFRKDLWSDVPVEGRALEAKGGRAAAGHGWLDAVDGRRVDPAPGRRF